MHIHQSDKAAQMNVALHNSPLKLTVAEELREFLRKKIELGNAEIDKRQPYDDDRLHWAGQVFAYEVMLLEVDRLFPRTVSSPVS